LNFLDAIFEVILPSFKAILARLHRLFPVKLQRY